MRTSVGIIFPVRWLGQPEPLSSSWKVRRALQFRSPVGQLGDPLPLIRAPGTAVPCAPPYKRLDSISVFYYILSEVTSPSFQSEVSFQDLPAHRGGIVWREIRRLARHDLRHHLNAMRDYLDSGDIKAPGIH